MAERDMLTFVNVPPTSPEPELSNCPNCGFAGDLERVSVSEVTGAFYDEMAAAQSQIVCPVCKFSGPVEDTLEQAELRWEMLPRLASPPALHQFGRYLARVQSSDSGEGPIDLDDGLEDDFETPGEE